MAAQSVYSAEWAAVRNELRGLQSQIINSQKKIEMNYKEESNSSSGYLPLSDVIHLIHRALQGEKTQ